MYNKLFGKIVTSSVWLERTPTRLLWVTMLAIMDKDGFVEMASTRNLAHTARLTEDEVLEALAILENADLDSSDPENEGRRVERVPGGWIVLNAQKYSQLVTREVARERTRERVAKHRAKRNGEVLHVTPSEVESKPSAKAKSKNREVGLTTNVRPDVLTVFAHWQSVHGHSDAKLSDKRKAIIGKALRDYSADQLCEAISGYLLSPFHMGANDRNTRYDSIELMLRDAAKIDAGMAFGRPQKPETLTWYPPEDDDENK